MLQKNAFLTGEGDQYFRRNKAAEEKMRTDTLGTPYIDPIVNALLPYKPESVLEIGCGTGWRLDVMKTLWGARVAGIEPSLAAIEGAYVENIAHGTADSIPHGDASFDCLIFGFCLYLCDRNDLFKIASEADRVLNDKGFLVICDFYPPHAYSNPYKHLDGLRSYKMDYSQLWSWHPSYFVVHHKVHATALGSIDNPDDRVCVTVLKKVA